MIAASTVGVVVALLIGVLLTREPATDRAVDSPLLGHAAPALSGVTIEGAEFDLDQLRGQWVVLNFFATWCRPCEREHPELTSFAARHEQAGDAAVVSVVFDDEPGNVRDFFEARGGAWPVVVGDVGRIALDYGVAGVPESFLIDPAGVVRFKIKGGVTSTGLDRLLVEAGGGA